MYHSKSIFGREEKLSESIQYLEDKTVLGDLKNSSPVDEGEKCEKLVLNIFFMYATAII